MNGCFIASQFPEDWRRSLIKFISKPNGKGYRPISLISAMGKLMERLVHRRMEHFIELNLIIPPHQFGFSKERSVIDFVGVLITDVMSGFSKNKGTIALALDIKGAFNALHPEVIYKQLKNAGSLPDYVI